MAHPATYTLLYADLSVEARPDQELLESIALPVQHLIGLLAPPTYSLEALRGALALLHGFVTLELNGQFQRGGDIGVAFQQSIQAYLDGWSQQP